MVEQELADWRRQKAPESEYKSHTSWSPSTVDPLTYATRAASRNLSVDYGKASPIREPVYLQSLKSTPQASLKPDDRRETNWNDEIARQKAAAYAFQQDLKTQETLTMLGQQYRQNEENYRRQIGELQSKAVTPRHLSRTELQPKTTTSPRQLSKTEQSKAKVTFTKDAKSPADKENIDRSLVGSAKKPIRSSSTERSRRSSITSIRSKSPLRSTSPNREVRDLELRKAKLQSEIRDLQQKKNKLFKSNKDTAGLKGYYEQRCKDLTAELTIWKDKTSDLATKHYSALRTIRKTQHELKVDAVRKYKEFKDNAAATFTDIKARYELEITKLRERLDRAERRKLAKKAK